MRRTLIVAALLLSVAAGAPAKGVGGKHGESFGLGTHGKKGFNAATAFSGGKHADCSPATVNGKKKVTDNTKSSSSKKDMKPPCPPKG